MDWVRGIFALAICLVAIACRAQGSSSPPVGGFQVSGEHFAYREGDWSIHGIFLKPEGKGPFPGVVISHGAGGSSDFFSLPKAREMVKWGFVCIGCDYTFAGQGEARRR